MHQQRLRLVAGLLTFFVGMSLASELRRPSRLDCYCVSAKCRLVFVIEHRVVSLFHPLATTELIWTARWGD